MQEKKNKQRLILLIVLAIATAGMMWMNMRDVKRVVEKDHFKKYDLKTVDKVMLLQGSDTVVLTTDGGRWKVNDIYNANGEMIDLLFATMMAAEPRRPVSSAMNDSIYEQLQVSGVKVSMHAGATVLTTFLAGGNPAKTQAYFASESDKKVYYMVIPGYRVYVSGIFENPVGGWRTTRVFDFNWQNFQRLVTNFPGNEGNNFSIEMKDFQVNLIGVNPVDTAKLNTYLDAVSLLTVDQYLSKDPSLDSLLLLKPLQTLTISDIGDRKHSLSFYPYGPEGYAGLIDEKDWAFFDRRKVAEIVHSKDFFKGQ
ncbi:DUF4340 domain-containing protein [Pseudochryseolinea flava]|uniref:DUF4340 domain-containing protein n=1 Tax=Pseudochryseolinea flava TaxID=2059302 RepID=A0A364Y4U9_9BACT|nr:DUF4340 domain-containing protein [Pseudochryseolinea flava]RAW01806.1 hypothetical protein DQQ10_09175 [Pseudochryseolinea flava]